MGSASATIERLRRSEVVTVEPPGARALRVGDVVLVRVRGRECLHLVKASQGDRCLIGNHRGGLNG